MLRNWHSDMSSSCPSTGERTRHQRHRFVVHVDEHANPRAQVELARPLRDVGGRIVMPEQRVQARVARLGDDRAVAVGVELVDHHPVVARQVVHALRRRVRQRAQAGSGAEPLHRGRHAAHEDVARDRRRRQLAGVRRRRLELQDQDTARGAVQRAFEAQALALGTAIAQRALQRNGRGQVGRGDEARDLLGAIAPQKAERPLQHVVQREAEERRDVGSRLLDHQRLHGQHQQHAVRLHGAGQVDQLAFAVGQVGLPEARAVGVRAAHAISASGRGAPGARRNRPRTIPASSRYRRAPPR